MQRPARDSSAVSMVSMRFLALSARLPDAENERFKKHDGTEKRHG